MNIFVTVGSTRFDSLIDKITSTSFLSILQKEGFTTMTIQHGNSPINIVKNTTSLKITTITYIDHRSFTSLVKEAHCIIAHCGSGIILDFLQHLKPGKSLFLVPNNLLMDDHQVELGEQIDALIGNCHLLRKGSCLEDYFVQNINSERASKIENNLQLAPVGSLKKEIDNLLLL